jgi:hypothetical protein
VLLPEGVEIAEKAVRAELTFEAALLKAGTHAEAVAGKGATESLIALAKLLVEVAK